MFNPNIIRKWIQLGINEENYAYVYNIASTPIFNGYKPIISFFLTDTQNAWNDNKVPYEQTDDTVTYQHYNQTWYRVRVNILGDENMASQAQEYAELLYNSVHKFNVKNYLNKNGLLYRDKTNLTNTILYGQDPNRNIYTSSFDTHFSFLNIFYETVNVIKKINYTRENTKKCIEKHIEL